MKSSRTPAGERIQDAVDSLKPAEERKTKKSSVNTYVSHDLLQWRLRGGARSHGASQDAKSNFKPLMKV